MAGVAAVFRPFSGTPRKKGYWMPIFGYNGIGANQVGLGDTYLHGNFNSARIATLGNPVLGGNMVSAHVYALPRAVGSPTWQIGVYDATGGVPANYTLLAISTPFLVTAGLPGQWFKTPIAGPLVAGNSYCAAVLEFADGAVWASMVFDIIPVEYTHQAFIVPGVFPDPLGVGSNSNQFWSLFVTYETADDGAPTAMTYCCLPHGHSNMNG